MRSGPFTARTASLPDSCSMRRQISTIPATVAVSNAYELPQWVPSRVSIGDCRHLGNIPPLAAIQLVKFNKCAPGSQLSCWTLVPPSHPEYPLDASLMYQYFSHNIERPDILESKFWLIEFETPILKSHFRSIVIRLDPN
jgi:hypothetical protein